LPWQPQAWEEAAHGGATDPHPPRRREWGPEFCPRGHGLVLDDWPPEGQRHAVAAGLAAAGMGPWDHLPRGASPRQPCLQKRLTDAEHGCEGTLGAEVLIVGMQELLSRVERLGFHAC
jgi:hypothetical protein